MICSYYSCARTPRYNCISIPTVRSQIVNYLKHPLRSYLQPQGISKGIEGGLSEPEVVVTFDAVSWVELTGLMDVIPGSCIPGIGDAPIDIPAAFGKGNEIWGTYIIDIGVDDVEAPTMGEKYAELALLVNPALERAIGWMFWGPDMDW